MWTDENASANDNNERSSGIQLPSWCWMVLVVLLLVSAFLALQALASCAKAEAPSGPRDPVISEWYRSLSVPSGIKQGWGCCDWSDCRNTEIRAYKDTFEAWVPSGEDRHAFPTGDNQWHVVPAEHILRGHDNITGEPVVCYYQGEILCLVLPSFS